MKLRIFQEQPPQESTVKLLKHAPQKRHFPQST